MPREHRELLQDFTRIWNLHDLIQAAPDEASAQALRAAHLTATTALAEFRTKHIQIISRYIIVPSKTGALVNGAGNACSHATMNGSHPRLAPVGTSGTELMPFLKQAREKTLQARVVYSKKNVGIWEGRSILLPFAAFAGLFLFTFFGRCFYYS